MQVIESKARQAVTKQGLSKRISKELIKDPKPKETAPEISEKITDSGTVESWKSREPFADINFQQYSYYSN